MKNLLIVFLVFGSLFSFADNQTEVLENQSCDLSSMEGLSELELFRTVTSCNKFPKLNRGFDKNILVGKSFVCYNLVDVRTYYSQEERMMSKGYLFREIMVSDLLFSLSPSGEIVLTSISRKNNKPTIYSGSIVMTRNGDIVVPENERYDIANDPQYLNIRFDETSNQLWTEWTESEGEAHNETIKNRIQNNNAIMSHSNPDLRVVEIGQCFIN